MAMEGDRRKNGDQFLLNPLLGNAATVVAALVFMLLCMLLPLVGPAGSATPFADKNYSACAAVLTAAVLTAGLATGINLKRRRAHGGAFPLFPTALAVMAVLTTLVFALGLLKI